MTSSDRVLVRAIIQFCSNIGKTPTETFKMMHTTAYNENLPCALVCKRHRRFSGGRSLLDDDNGKGRKPRIESDTITSNRDEFDIDRRLTVSHLATMAYVSIWTVCIPKI